MFDNLFSRHELRLNKGGVATEYHRPYHWEENGLGLKIQLERFRFAKKFITPNDYVLDIGCGDGFLTDKLACISRKVVGVDPSPSGLKFAKSKITRTNVDLVLGFAESLPFKSDFFNAVTLFEVIEHIPVNRVNNVVEELFRVLKRSGKIILTTPNPYNLWNRLSKKPKVSAKHCKEYTGEELLHLFKKFKTLEFTGIYLPLPPFFLFHKPRYSFIYDKLISLGRKFPRESLFTCYCGEKP